MNPNPTSFSTGAAIVSLINLIGKGPFNTLIYDCERGVVDTLSYRYSQLKQCQY